MSKLLTIFAHQDDETFSAGGILAKYGENDKAYAVSVTSDPNRKQEFVDACSHLNTEPITLGNSLVTPKNSTAIKQQIKETILNLKADHVITHLDFDYHHEHKLVRKLVVDAVEWVSHTTGQKDAHQVKSLWAAETTILIPFPEIYIDISSFNQQRISAIKCYESQNHKGGKGFYSKFHNMRTKLRGIQADVDHAEAFVNIPLALSGSFKPVKVFDKLPF